VAGGALVLASALLGTRPGAGADLGGPPRKVIAIAPSAAEILFALGEGDRVIAVPDVASDLPGAAGKVRIGGFSPDLERIVSLAPDLVVASRDGTDRASFERVRALGFRVVVTRGTTLEGIFEDIRTVGAALGTEKRAEVLVASLRARLGRARARIAESARLRPLPSVLILIWPDPPVVAGPASFLGDLLRQAGIRNAAEDAGEWPRVSFETLARWDPGLIVRPETRENADAFGRTFRTNSLWKLIPAARDGRVVSIPGNWLERPGPRLIDALEALSDRIGSGLP
jgi:iron complex transport system substrate-binding protein